MTLADSPQLWARIPDEFPATQRYTYLNTASTGLLPLSVAAQMQAFYHSMAEAGTVARPGWQAEVEQVRHEIADWLNADADEIAIVPSTAAAMQFLAKMLPGHSVSLLRADYPAVNAAWEMAGAPCHRIPSASNGTVDWAKLEAQNSDILALSHVQWQSGFRLPLDRLSALCREKGQMLLLDATQSFAACPIDLRATPVDALIASTYKWALGGFGATILYVSRALLERFPVKMYWRFYEPDGRLPASAQRFEIGHDRFDAALRLGHSLRYLKALGREALFGQVASLQAQLYEAIAAAGLPLVSDYSPEYRSPIVVLEGGAELFAKAEAAGLITSLRDTGLRLSVHFYNSPADIERAVGLLAEMRR